MNKFSTIAVVILLCIAMVFTACTKTDTTTKTEDEPKEEKKTEKVEEATTEEVSYLDNMNEPGVLPLVKEKVELTVLVPLPATVEDIETNGQTLWMEERTNIHINWQNIAGEDASQKVNLILASGTDLPDIISRSGIGLVQQAQYGAEGTFIKLLPLIEKYGINIKKAIEYDAGIVNQVKTPDGSLYSIGHFEECYHCTLSQKMWINQVWLDNLGLETPETTDDFYNVLKAFKENDPNGNGVNDEIPLSGTPSHWHSIPTDFLINGWIYTDGGDRLNVEDGVVYPAFTQDEFKEGLLYCAMLVEEGLMDAESFTQETAQLKQMVTPELTILGSFPTGAPAMVSPNDSEMAKQYTALAPLAGPNGNRTTAYYPSTVSQTSNIIITNACEIPEIAFSYIDYQYGEEVLLNNFGEENVDWRYADEGEIGIDGNPAVWELLTVFTGVAQNKAWLVNVFPAFYNNRLFAGRVATDDPWVIEKRLYNETENKYQPYAPDEYMQPLSFTAEETEIYAELKTVINEYVKESIARFVTNNVDVEEGWDEYITELDNMGLEDYLDLVNTVYSRQYN